MIGFLTSLLTGGLGAELRRAYEAKLAASNDSERIAAELEIARLETAQANRALGGKITALVQAAWAAPFIAYNWKLIVWDKILGLGTTDTLSSTLLEMQATIAMFYFGGAAAIGVVRAIKR